MLTLNDGRNELWQWDTGRNLTVDADCSQVHFSNKVFGRSIDVDVVDGVAIIPDILLQTDKELTAWAFVGTAENGYTKISKVFKVNKRNKPADYVFTPTDQTTLGEILDRIEDLENRPSGDISKEDIQNAVSDYLDKNPVSIEEKDPTVPAWAKQPEPPKVEIPEVDTPDALPNPHKLTFTGAVEAEYDGSKEVTVEIPKGGGGGIEVTGAEVGQTIVVKAVDENGKPTEWESIDMVDGSFPLIAEVILEEEVSSITIDTDIKGDPLNLSEMYVCVRFYGGTPNEEDSKAAAYLNKKNTATQRHQLGRSIPAYGTATHITNNYVYWYLKLKYGYLCEGHGLENNYVTNLLENSEHNTFVSDKITAYSLYCATTGYAFGVGTNIRIYGR